MNAYSIDIPTNLIDDLQRAQRVVVLTGSGISAESGIPTFREAQTGLWAQYNPMELATPAAFNNNPKLVWEWYAWRRSLVSKARPNQGHAALVQMESIVPHFTLITQNVDGLHQQAGSQHIIELHGNIMRSKCSIENKFLAIWKESKELPPRCPNCGGLIRPDVVWFGEGLPTGTLEMAQQLTRDCDLFFSIGTSGIVQPAASLPWLALEKKALVVEINLEETHLTPNSHYFLKAPAGKALPEIIEKWKERRSIS